MGAGAGLSTGTDGVGVTTSGEDSIGRCLSKMRSTSAEIMSSSAVRFMRFGSPWVRMWTLKLSRRFAVFPHDRHAYRARAAWTVRRCFASPPLSGKAPPQLRQMYGFAPECRNSWAVSRGFVLKDFPHVVHTWPVTASDWWTTWCVYNVDAVLKDLPHVEQENARSVVCTDAWTSRLLRYMNVWPQTSQTWRVASAVWRRRCARSRAAVR